MSLLRLHFYIVILIELISSTTDIKWKELSFYTDFDVVCYTSNGDESNQLQKYQKNKDLKETIFKTKPYDNSLSFEPDTYFYLEYMLHSDYNITDIRIKFDYYPNIFIPESNKTYISYKPIESNEYIPFPNSKQTAKIEHKTDEVYISYTATSMNIASTHTHVTNRIIISIDFSSKSDQIFDKWYIRHSSIEIAEFDKEIKEQSHDTNTCLGDIDDKTRFKELRKMKIKNLRQMLAAYISVHYDEMKEKKLLKDYNYKKFTEKSEYVRAIIKFENNFDVKKQSVCQQTNEEVPPKQKPEKRKRKTKKPTSQKNKKKNHKKSAAKQEEELTWKWTDGTSILLLITLLFFVSFHIFVQWFSNVGWYNCCYNQHRFIWILILASFTLHRGDILYKILMAQYITHRSETDSYTMQSLYYNFVLICAHSLINELGYANYSIYLLYSCRMAMAIYFVCFFEEIFGLCAGLLSVIHSSFNFKNVIILVVLILSLDSFFTNFGYGIILSDSYEFVMCYLIINFMCFQSFDFVWSKTTDWIIAPLMTHCFGNNTLFGIIKDNKFVIMASVWNYLISDYIVNMTTEYFIYFWFYRFIVYKVPVLLLYDIGSKLVNWGSRYNENKKDMLNFEHSNDVIYTGEVRDNLIVYGYIRRQYISIPNEVSLLVLKYYNDLKWDKKNIIDHGNKLKIIDGGKSVRFIGDQKWGKSIPKSHQHPIAFTNHCFYDKNNGEIIDVSFKIRNVVNCGYPGIMIAVIDKNSISEIFIKPNKIFELDSCWEIGEIIHDLVQNFSSISWNIKQWKNKLTRQYDENIVLKVQFDFKDKTIRYFKNGIQQEKEFIIAPKVKYKIAVYPAFTGDQITFV